MKYKTREQWLQAGVARLRKLIPASYAVPDVRVSCGFPKNARGKGHTIGQCWYTAEDGVAQVFISPTQVYAPRILDVLLHEMGHAILGSDVGHKKEFKRFMDDVGLEGKATATVASDKLSEKLVMMSKMLGDYPHSKLTARAGMKKQSTRLLKVECECCGYVVRTTQKWIDTGLPSCPQGIEMEVK